MVYTCVKWINTFPLKGSMSKTLSPRAIITGTQLNFKTDCHLQFGAYMQAHLEPSPSNTQEACTVGAICLGPTGYIQGSFEFLNLCTSRKITHQRWTMLPISQDVIDCMNQFSKVDSQPNILTFSDHQGNPVGNLQVPVESKAPTKISGVQLTPIPIITETIEQAIPEDPPFK